MQNLNYKISFGTYLFIIFIAFMLVSIFAQSFLFEQIIAQTGGNQFEASEKATAETSNLLLSLDKITLDISVLSSPYFSALTTLPSYPIDAVSLYNFGKANPFLGSFVVVSSPATTTVGSVIYSNQRGANNNNSIRPVSPTGR